MTKKELFDGLNYIDDQIIEEAQPIGESAGYSDEIYVKNHETHHGGKEDKNRKKMRKDNNMIIQLQRYYALWKECTAMYEEWSKDQGLSSNGVFALHSFYESNGRCTQKMISEKWNIPKQTVNTILKDFQKKGYINMVSDDSDKRNKLICLTESGMEYTKDIIEKLHSKEIYVIEKMGLENIESLNDNTELFIRLFKEGDCKKNES